MNRTSASASKFNTKTHSNPIPFSTPNTISFPALIPTSTQVSTTNTNNIQDTIPGLISYADMVKKQNSIILSTTPPKDPEKYIKLTKKN